MHRLLALLGVGLVGAGAFFYWVMSAEETGEEQAAVCALVIDHSGSTASDSTTELNRRLAGQAIAGCRERRARTTVYQFQGAGQPLAQAGDGAFDLWLPTGDKRAAQESTLEDAIGDAESAVDEAFDGPATGGGGSDILAALEQAADDLAGQARSADVSERHLIIVTDGMQLSADVSVDDIVDESTSIEPMVDRAVELGLVSGGLDGTDVTFLGVGSAVNHEGDPVPAWFERQVEAFWRGVVSAGGGSTCRYSALITDDPLNCE